MSKGTSVKIFLVDGSPDGLRIVEKSNWTGRALACSRAQFSQIKNRPEFKKTGVYLLVGFDDESQTPIVYLGEGDPVLSRIESHEKNKDFWNLMIVFTNKDENLNKAHIQYIESRLIQIVKKTNRAKLDNLNSPMLPALSEADIADMENYIIEMQIIYSLLGIKIFESVGTAKSEVISANLEIKSGSQVIGYGIDLPEGFKVFKKSKCLKKEVPSFIERLKPFRDSLISRGVIVLEGEFYVFAQDYIFNSPSQAAYTILGRPANGRLEWKNSIGQSINDLE